MSFACFGQAPAQNYYKWIDKDGKVQFADKPPAGFKGEVTKVPIDAMPESAPRVPVRAAKPAAEGDAKEKPLDPAGERRKNREQLAARLSAARQKLEAARKALADGEDATQDERRFVRQEFPRNERRPERTPQPRANCMSQTTADGKTVWNCPRSIPGEPYFERQAKLEEAVRLAEEEVAEAERAYRRGVD